MRKRVLIADDNAYIRQAVRQLLEAAEFDVCAEVENGAEAIEQSENLKPDLVVLDLAMPVMNGLEAAPVIRKKLPTVPILLFTLYADLGLEKTAASAGVTLVLAKGDAPERLVQTARALLQS
jgi:DNA-binding NarL/FixJ family response regulator